MRGPEEELAALAERERRLSLGAEHARHHLQVIADASRVLLQSTDRSEASLGQLVDALVPAFASYATVVLAGRGGPGLHQLCTATAAPAATPGGGPDELDRDALVVLDRLMSQGRTRLISANGPTSLRPQAGEGGLAGALHQRALGACIVAPISVRGLSFGALLVATSIHDRGYRPSDLAVAEELARRIAQRIETDLLYDEARVSASLADRHALRLKSLVDVWLRVSAVRDAPGALAVAREGAGRLLPHARVTIVDGSTTYGDTRLSASTLALLRGAEGIYRSKDAPVQLGPADADALGEHWLAVPLPASPGVEAGIVVICGGREPFAPEDESLLLLIGRMVTAARVHAALDRINHDHASELETLVAAIPVAIVQLDAELRVRGNNPAAAELFGWHRAPSRALPGSVRTALEELMALPAHERRRQQRDCAVSDGEAERSLTVRLADLGVSRSSTRHLLVVTDDSERQRLARQFAQVQRLEAVGLLAGGVAHDFNNLLTVILGYADGMLRRLDIDDPRRDRVAAIHRAGTRGARLTSQLLAISRTQVLNPTVLSPALVIDEMRELAGQLVGESISVVRERGGEDLLVRMDRAQLEQTLLNLESNAADAMPGGGVITVTVGAGQPTAAATAPAPYGWVAIRVSDDGAGMDAATVARCLEPLFTTKAPGKGTGLGLATAHTMTRQQGGDLVVDTAPGRGTTVTLLLPATIGIPQQATESRLPTPLDRPAFPVTGTVLLVEDDHEIRWMVWRALRERGFDTLVADSAQRAFELLFEYDGPLDLVISDVAMPGISGPEFVRTLLQTREVPVLFVSGYAEQLTTSTQSLGPDVAFLTKPFTPDQLFVAIDGCLARFAQGSKR